MRAEELLETLTDEELKKRANGCFIQAEHTSLYQQVGPAERQRLLTEADFYLNALIWRSDARVSRRDFRMELIVIFLILLEALIGIGGIIFGIKEGNKQAAILDRMNTSTAATATATQGVNTSSQDQAAKLKTLADEQTKSLDSLTEMNEKLRASLKQTSDMTAAMQEQLKILKDDQASRQAQLAKKPRLELDVGSVPLNTFFKVTFKAREVKETLVTYDAALKNLGDATATKGLVRVVIYAKDVNFQTNAPFQRTNEEPDSPSHTFLIPFDYLRPGVTIPMSFTFTYPKGQQPFTVIFNVDADELSVATPLGSLTIKPLKPDN
jgi:cell division protein FtsB